MKLENLSTYEICERLAALNRINKIIQEYSHVFEYIEEGNPIEKYITNLQEKHNKEIEKRENNRP